MPDFSKYTDQEIIDGLRKRKSLPKQLKTVISTSIENNFKEHNIALNCPRCNSSEYVSNGQNANGAKKYKCKQCGKSFTASANTIFECTSYSWDEMVDIIHMIIRNLSMIDISANSASDKLGTTWMIVHKILHLLNIMSDNVKLSGVIQIDEKYFREVQKGSHNLKSFVEPSKKRKARKHNYASKCGIFGPEFVNVLCAVDNNGHYWAKCVCLGPMNMDELEIINPYLSDVSYICTDMNDIYFEWCDKHNFTHYVEPSTYRTERKARGYIDTDSLYHKLTDKEYKFDETINRQMYKERRYPHIRNSDKPLPFDEFNVLRYKFGLGINGVNAFHSMLDRYLIKNTTGVSSVYLQDYVGAFVYLQNYKTDHNIKCFTKQAATDILCKMIYHTLKYKDSPKDKDILNKQLELRRPSKKSINKSKEMIQEARKIINVSKDDRNKSGFEGDDNTSMYIFNKYKFFNNIGGKRLNELIKENGLYRKGAHKNEKVKKMCELSNVQDIIFREIYLQNYGTLNEFKDAIDGSNNTTTVKGKRGRPKGSKNKKTSS